MRAMGADHFLGMQSDADYRKMKAQQSFLGTGSTQNITSNVTQNIHSSADPKAVADEATKNWRELQQNELSGIYIQLDQGANY
jgi:hypothetical protein